MRSLVQRVDRASVSVDGEILARIGPGLLLLVGVTHGDDEAVAHKMADKLWHLRVFDDVDGKMNRSAADTTGELLVVSQFTLYGDTRKGRRPSWTEAAPPDVAEPLIDELAQRLRELGARVETGVFRAHMTVELVNDGPVTLMIEVPAP